ncbi:hypothetical protein [Gloeocapsopsis dulcis]|uniref:Glycosyltransferase RgtA/B/C/D-like domain-containing protein n=1 Tax=Gloeocapsopsis dulcis AAB1 = 1H9 TaxID=1433147 RepID=A0A6N8FU90_9CHRO|nr:hypothetical protein [Gloeocapsopsis dulcis]MUL36690.1 hypothetical protein [Gloeocapsopsis dulcis AAB1 = 1H9]WNN91264.1 hypothetical protein P0S91_09420 [Gloeocapsopsis dulcis]
MPYKSSLAQTFNKKQQLNLTVVVIIILIPAAYIFYWITQSGEISTDDYWYIISHFYSTNGFSSQPTDWLVRSNEHLVLIPAIIYALNIIVTKGSNIGLSSIALLFALGQAILLATLLPDNLRRSRSLFVVVLLCISIFCFTPAAAQNWMRGFSGVAWIGANLFVTAAIFCLTKLVHSQKIFWAISSLLFAVLGSLTYSTAIAVFPVLCLAVLLTRLPLRIVLLYVSGAIAVCTIYILTYRTPDYHRPLSPNASDIFTFIPTYLGAVFTIDIDAARSIGIVGLIIAICCVGYWLTPQARTFRTSWLPWLVLQGYVIGTAFMGAVSRSGFGVESAMQSRYASLPSLFWLSLTVIVLIGLQKFRLNGTTYWQLLITLLAGLTVLILSMYRVGTEASQMIARTASLQPLVTLSVQLGVADTDIIKQVITPSAGQFLNLTDALKQHRLVPFHRPFQSDSLCAFNQQLSSDSLKPSTPQVLPGFFDNLTKLTPEIARVEGWARNRQHRDINCVAILNQNNIVRGFVLTGFPRSDVAKALGRSYAFSGWKGYVRLSPEDQTLFAYASSAPHTDWIKLQNAYKLHQTNPFKELN